MNQATPAFQKEISCRFSKALHEMHFNEKAYDTVT